MIFAEPVGRVHGRAAQAAGLRGGHRVDVGHQHLPGHVGRGEPVERIARYDEVERQPRPRVLGPHVDRERLREATRGGVVARHADGDAHRRPRRGPHEPDGGAEGQRDRRDRTPANGRPIDQRMRQHSISVARAAPACIAARGAPAELERADQRQAVAAVRLDMAAATGARAAMTRIKIPAGARIEVTHRVLDRVVARLPPRELVRPRTS